MPSILIVSAFFAPSGRIGGRRAEKIAGHLARHGWDVSVLTMHARHAPPLDPNLKIPENIEVIRTGAFVPRSAFRKLSGSPERHRSGLGSGKGDPSSGNGSLPRKALSMLRRGANRAIRHLLSRFEYLDEFSGWKPFALRAIRGRHFDVVLATLPPFSTAWIGLVAAQRCGAKLVIDYRDPWREFFLDKTLDIHDSGKLLRRHQQIEQMCLDHATMIIGVSPTICNSLRERTRAPVEVVPQGFDPVDANATAPARNPVRLVYAGTLAYGRALRPVFAAIALLRDAILPGELQLVYCGPNGNMARTEADDVGVGEYLRDLGQVSASRVRDIMLSGTVGIVIISAGYEYAYPGKLFDILGTGRPILLIGPPRSDAAELLARHRLGWSHSESDITGIADTIRSAIEGASIAPVGLKELSVSTLMNRLAALLDRALADGPGPLVAPVTTPESDA
ncbi:MAG: glycosyltransferase [Acidiferrobacterales bacterium]